MTKAAGDIFVKLYDGSGGIYDRTKEKVSTIWEYTPGGLRVPREDIIDTAIKYSRSPEFDNNTLPVTILDNDLASLVLHVRDGRRPKADSGASRYQRRLQEHDHLMRLSKERF